MLLETSKAGHRTRTESVEELPATTHGVTYRTKRDRVDVVATLEAARATHPDPSLSALAATLDAAASCFDYRVCRGATLFDALSTVADQVFVTVPEATEDMPAQVRLDPTNPATVYSSPATAPYCAFTTVESLPNVMEALDGQPLEIGMRRPSMERETGIRVVGQRSQAGSRRDDPATGRAWLDESDIDELQIMAYDHTKPFFNRFRHLD